ncbi:MAG: HAMP domain-containing histidine kinase [Bacteroidales bacterium]|nr:HAMP domain-containing histidine kinase [Bacteroidales bacterium]
MLKKIIIPRKIRPSMLVMAAIALLSIAGIQYYYIYITYKAQEALFDKKVYESMAHATYLIEKKEISAQFKSKIKSGIHYSKEQKLIHTLDSLNQELFKSLRRFGIDSNISDSVARETREKISYQVAMDQYGELIRNIDTTKVKQSQATLDLLDIYDIHFKKKFNPEKIKDKNLLIKLFGDVESFLRKSFLISDVFTDFFNLTHFFPIETRLDSVFLDSLLREEFDARQIRTDFYFTIYSSRRDTFIYQPPKSILEKLKETPYRYKLYPSDLFYLSDYLLVFFPEKKKFLYQQSANMVIISVSLILTVLTIFVYLLFIFYQQKRLSEEKTKFINNMAHEIKTPLSTIRLACDMLVEEKNMNMEEKEKLIHIIALENNRLMNLSEHILRSAFIQKGTMKLSKKPFHVHEILEQAIQKIEFWVYQKNGQIRKIFKAQNDLVMADAVHMENVFYNILDNAFKYCKDFPDIEVATENRNGFLLVSISDHGIGISPDEQERVFDMLYRAQKENIHDVKGFGIGLHYVKTVIDMHGFDIKLKSVENEGSEFIIKMPLYGNS